MIRAQCGEPFERLVPVLDAAGLPVALTSSWSARVQVRPSPRSATVLHEWATTGGSPNAFIVTGADGGVRLVASEVETATWQDTWPPTPQCWDLELSDPAGVPYVIDLGRIVAEVRVSR